MPPQSRKGKLEIVEFSTTTGGGEKGERREEEEQTFPFFFSVLFFSPFGDIRENFFFSPPLFLGKKGVAAHQPFVRPTFSSFSHI